MAGQPSKVFFYWLTKGRIYTRKPHHQDDGADVIGRPMDEGPPQDPWLQTSQATTVWPVPIEHDAINGDHIAHVGAASLEHQAHYEPNPTVLGSAQQQSPPEHQATLPTKGSSPALDTSKVCECVGCIYEISSLFWKSSKATERQCPNPSCRLTFRPSWASDFCKHVFGHAKYIAGQNPSSVALERYWCLEQHCHFNTKRQADLARHYRTKHCENPPNFPCQVLGCKYGGENGFVRKDKLKSHYKNVHEGKLPGKAFQAIEPKPRAA